jgi:CHAT domain-containing protein
MFLPTIFFSALSFSVSANPEYPYTTKIRADLLQQQSQLLESIQGARDSGKRDQLTKQQEKLLSVERELLGDFDPMTIDTRLELAQRYILEQRFPAAKIQLDRAFADATTAFGPRGELTITAKVKLQTYAIESKLPEATKKLIQQANQSKQEAGKLLRASRTKQALEKLAQSATRMGQAYGIESEPGVEAELEYAEASLELAGESPTTEELAAIAKLYLQSIPRSKILWGAAHSRFRKDLRLAETVLDGWANLARRNGNHKEAILALQAAITFYTSLFGAEDWRATRSKNELLLQERVGKMSVSEKQVYEQARSEMDQASKWIEQGKFESAAKAFSSAEATLSKLVGDDLLLIAFLKTQHAYAEQRAGNIDEGIRLREEALPVLIKYLGKHHPDASGVADKLSDLLRDRIKSGQASSNFKDSKKNLERLLALKQVAFGKDHWLAQDIELQLAENEKFIQLSPKENKDNIDARQLAERARVKYDAGNFPGSLSDAEKALQIRIKLFGKESAGCANSYLQVATIKLSLGRLDEARKESEISKKIIRKYYHPNHQMQHLLADLSFQLEYEVGNVTLAREALTKCQEVVSHARKDLTFDPIRVAMQQASFESQFAGDPVRAKQALDRANELLNEMVYQRSLMNQDWNNDEKILSLRAELFHDRAGYLIHSGEYNLAEQFLKAALNIRLNRDDEPGRIAATLNALGWLKMKASPTTFATAEPYLIESHSRITQLLGDNHPDSIQASVSLAFFDAGSGNFQKAEERYLQLQRLPLYPILKKTPSLSQVATHLALIQLQLGKKDKVLQRAAEAEQSLFTHLERTAVNQSERQQLASLSFFRTSFDGYLSVAWQTKAPAAEVYSRVLAWKGAVFDRLVRRSTDPKIEAKRIQCVEASQNYAKSLRSSGPDLIRAAEAKLEQLEIELKELTGQSALAEVNPKTIAATLPKHSVLFDFVQYTNPIKPHGRETRLSVFVIQQDQAIVWLDLGPVTEIDQQVQDWRKKVNLALSGKLDAAELKTNRAEIDKIASNLRDRIWKPLSQYAKDRASVYLSPDGSIALFPFGAMPGDAPNAYLIEEVNLGTIPIPRLIPKLVQNQQEFQTALFLGDVDYNGRYDSIPTSAIEQASFLKLAPKTKPPVELTQQQATLQNLKASIAGKQWLHLSTHGRFNNLQDASGYLLHRPAGLASLILANGEEVSALEISHWDLAEARQVVLSACQSGEGMIQDLNGTSSLQKAFQLGGASTVIATLWPVPGPEAAKILEQYYEKNAPGSKSMVQAQRDFINKYTRNGIRPDPSRWAAWSLAGW